MDAVLSFDFAILEAIRTTHNAFLDTFFKLYTSLGNAGLICIIPTLGFLAFAKTRKLGLSCALSLILDLLVCNIILKPLIRRPRPFDFFPGFSPEELIIEVPTDFSFPSGHTAACFAFSAALFMHNKKLGCVSFALSLLMGYSRLYLGVHYPTDIIGGMLVGTLCGIAAYHIGRLITGKIKTKREN